MRAGADRERRRQELAACAEEVFDALFPEDLAALLARYGPRSSLRDGVVERAEKIIDKLAKTADPVRSLDYHLVIAACFTWGRNQAGVATNTNHAVKKFLRYRRFAELPLGILVRTDRTVPDDEWVIVLLARSLRVRAGVTDARADQEPELILNMAVPAIVAALGPKSGQPSGPDADAILVGTALDVLDRGAELAAAYRMARRRIHVEGTDLPVAGNADFLVRIAAYRLAIEERRGVVMTQPLDELEQAVGGLSSILRREMTRSAGRWNRRGPDEPDVATAIDQYASYLGSTCGADTARRAVCAVHSVLSYRLGLGEPPDETVMDDFDAVSPPPSEEPPSRLPEVEHLVSWLIAALLRGAGPAAREPLLEWLDGKQVPNESKNLPLLVRRLRVATRVLDQARASRPPRPAGITTSQFEALTARLSAAVDPGEITGHPQHDARLVTLSALPPLWTRRRPAMLLVTAHLRVLIGQRSSAALQAVLVATHGVRAPVQFVQKSAGPLPDRCCPDAAGDGRSAWRGGPREPVHYQEICPHRPWGEVGWVENYRTLGEAAGCSAEATRKQLARYQGPWRELLWH